MGSLKAALIKSNFSFLLVVGLFFSFLFSTSINYAVELDETTDSVECTISQDNNDFSHLGNLFLPVPNSLPETQSVFLEKELIEVPASVSFASNTLRPFRGPPPPFSA